LRKKRPQPYRGSPAENIATRVWIGGNHDGPGGWERQLVEENPELEGSIERDKLYKLVRARLDSY